MNRLSALDAFGPAFARVGTMLFKPFRLSVWLKVGFIGLLGGGMARFGGNINYNFQKPVLPPNFPHEQLPRDPWAEIQSAIRSIHLADYLHIIMIVVAVSIVISIIFLYLFCRFRFVLFDAVVSGQAVVGRGWRRYASQANRYFGFWLVYRLVNLAVIALIVGVPLWNAYKRGVFSGDNSLMALFEVLASIALGAVAASVVFAIISTLAKDFLMPIMALDDLALGDAWSALWRVIAAEPGAWAGYMGMKLVCAFGAGIALVIATFIAILPAILIIGIPVGLLVAVGVVVLKSAGAVAGGVIFGIAGLLAAAGILILIMILTAPFTVFFASYAFYFFGGRYPKLGALLAPQPSPQPQIMNTQPVR